jgi:hypothetical protein
MKRPVALALLFGLLASIGFLCAQEFRGTFSGRVVDEQGAVVAKAKVMATEMQTETGRKL